MVQWTLREAARECGVSADTVKRRLAVLREHGATKDDAGAWRVTPDQLRAAGLHPGQPTGAPEVLTKGSDPGRADGALVQRIAVLERDLAVERARREGAEALAAERERALSRADLALRAIEGRPAQAAAEGPAEPARRRWWGGRAPA